MGKWLKITIIPIVAATLTQSLLAKNEPEAKTCRKVVKAMEYAIKGRESGKEEYQVSYRMPISSEGWTDSILRDVYEIIPSRKSYPLSKKETLRRERALEDIYSTICVMVEAGIAPQPDGLRTALDIFRNEGDYSR